MTLQAIKVLGRRALPSRLELDTALISIADPGRVTPAVVCAAMLFLTFDDVDNVEHAAYTQAFFTLAHAQTVTAFVVKLPPEVTTLICQCEHGISRSAGLAKAIAESLGLPFENPLVENYPRYRPNPLVYRLTTQAFAAYLSARKNRLEPRDDHRVPTA
jgi:predicted protein tyrosine phosphatase